MSDFEEQGDELTAVESIFDNDENVFEYKKDCNHVHSGQFKIPVVLEHGLIRQCLVKVLDTTLSENIGFPVLFACFQAMKDEIEKFFDWKDPKLDVTKVCENRKMGSNKCSPGQLFKVLQEFDADSRRDKFDRKYFRCEVCYDEFRGKDCIQFEPCNHVYCVKCTHEFFHVLITEGAIYKVGCMTTNCDSLATKQQVSKCMSSALTERFERLQLSLALDVMHDMTTCPRPTCGQPVLLEPHIQGGFDPLGACLHCHYNFCVHCRKGFHGIAPCTFTVEDRKRVVIEYEEAAPEVKRVMEKMYGKNKLQQLLNEAMCDTWKSNNAQPCPNCRCSIEKSDGCNKMTCSKCGSFFCWLCMKLLPNKTPYIHFNDPKSKCYNQLFQGVEEINDRDFIDPDLDIDGLDFPDPMAELEFDLRELRMLGIN